MKGKKKKEQLDEVLTVTGLIESHQKRSDENKILRQAARILFDRDKAHDTVFQDTVKVDSKSGLKATLTVTYHF